MCHKNPINAPAVKRTGGQTVGAIGLSLVVLALVINEWLLAYCFSSDGVIEDFNRVLIRVFECLTAAVGALLICFRRRIPPFALVVTPIAVIVGLGVIEVFLRATEPRPFALARPNPAGTGSFRMKPNLDFVYPYGENNVRITTNSHGMRWREVSSTKPAGKERVAFVGDSFIFGESADSVEESMAGVFESKIDQSKYEVLNFGMVGYGFADIRLQLKEQIFAFDPEYVIIVSFNGNDFRDTYLGLNQYDIVKGVITRNWDTLMAKVPAAYRPLRKENEAAAGSSSSGGLRLVRLLERALARMYANATEREAPRPPEKELCEEKRVTVTSDFTSIAFWSASSYPDVVRDAKDVSLRELSRIHALCKERDVKLLVVALPFEEQVYADAPTGIDPNGIAYDISLPQRHMEVWARDDEVPFLDLLPILRTHVMQEGLCLYPVGLDLHLNTLGHSIAARAIVEFFQAVVEEESHDAESNAPDT